jgi:tetratricopeptide (TPR) repeat protein
MLVILLLGCVASLRCGCEAFVQFPRMHGGSATTLRAAVYRRPLAVSTCTLDGVIRLRRRAPPGGGVADSTMQLRTISPEFEPGMDTLVMKPQRGAVSAAAPFSGSTAPTEREKETEVPELRVRMLEAKELTKRGDYRAADEMYSQLCATYPTAGKVWMKRFNLARKQRFYGKAREVLQDSLKHNPCNAILWQAWADLERSLGRVKVARKLYHKGLEANPWLPSLYNSWGAMERECGRTDAARQLFREGLNHDGKSVRLLLSSGMLEDVEGNTEGARSLFRRGLLVEPGNSFLLHALGMLEYKAGDVAAAREAFRAAVQANSDHTQSWLAWGQLEEAQGNVAIARAHYVEGCKARGGRGMVQLWQAWARMEEKHTNGASALEVYHKVILHDCSDIHSGSVRLD